MKPMREDLFIELFLSAYENGSWADAQRTKPDAVDRTNPAVDKVATRMSDGKTLAIEHTIIEPFLGDKEDFASFLRAGFLGIEKDESLLVPGRCIQVFVPVGTLRNRLPQSRDAIVESVRRWIRSNRLILPDGKSQRPLSITGFAGEPPVELTLTLDVVPLQRGSAERGSLLVRRQEVGNSLGDVIEKALNAKLPKLVNTGADKRILLLERQHMNLSPKRMLGEIEKRRASFPDSAGVHEIWIVETILYGTAFGGTYVRFELYEGGNVVGSFDFEGGRLMTTSEDSVGEVIPKVGNPST